MNRVTRRALLMVTGGGAAAGLGWWLGAARVDRAPAASARRSEALDAPGRYVDHDGWMMSADDKAGLAEALDRAETSD